MTRSGTTLVARYICATTETILGEGFAKASAPVFCTPASDAAWQARCGSANRLLDGDSIPAGPVSTVREAYEDVAHCLGLVFDRDTGLEVERL